MKPSTLSCDPFIVCHLRGRNSCFHVNVFFNLLKCFPYFISTTSQCHVDDYSARRRLETYSFCVNLPQCFVQSIDTKSSYFDCCPLTKWQLISGMSFLLNPNLHALRLYLTVPLDIILGYYLQTHKIHSFLVLNPSRHQSVWPTCRSRSSDQEVGHLLQPLRPVPSTRPQVVQRWRLLEITERMEISTFRVTDDKPVPLDLSSSNPLASECVCSDKQFSFWPRYLLREFTQENTVTMDSTTLTTLAPLRDPHQHLALPSHLCGNDNSLIVISKFAGLFEHVRFW